MNRKELVDFIADKVDTTKADSERMVEAFMEAVTTTLAKKDSVVLTGFGTFSTSERAARTARNPRTGETVNVSARTAPKFKPGKKLKDAVNA
ncbi:MAG: HU family DNA-binding protein [Aquificae bacterium]|nr:HU family DNA-binding protein [Aquificota bacterium]